MLNSYVFNFEIRRSYKRQSSIFEEFVRSAPKVFLRPFFKHWYKAVMSTEILVFRVKMCKIYWHFFKHESFVHSLKYMQNHYWSVVTFDILGTLLWAVVIFAHLNSYGKTFSYTVSPNMSVLSLIVLDHYQHQYLELLYLCLGYLLW